jgi:TM2 domain-containing membrane protein YozV
MAKKRGARKVNWILCLIMSVVFGMIGVDRFMMGKIGTGILKLITFGGLGIWWLVDVVLIAKNTNTKTLSGLNNSKYIS